MSTTERGESKATRDRPFPTPSTSALQSELRLLFPLKISLFGPAGQKGLQASVVIDGSDSQSGVIAQSTKQNQLFASSVLHPGQHTINVTVLTGDSTAIDYFLVESPPATTTVSQAFKALPIAAIVGSAVGALVLLVLILVGLLIRRRRAHIRSNQYISQFVTPTGPQQAGSDAAIVSRRQTLQHEAHTSLGVGQSVTSESVHSTLPSYHEETTEVPPPYLFKRAFHRPYTVLAVSTGCYSLDKARQIGSASGALDSGFNHLPKREIRAGNPT
ncbi:hypothetical protein K438DRAFT_1755557 [Mycena galopus ATCC 62051]|nr:hypothetical protein K438DRAFT_1755557 [Mycena galopus ATCC 62051]